MRRHDCEFSSGRLPRVVVALRCQSVGGRRQVGVDGLRVAASLVGLTARQPDDAGSQPHDAGSQQAMPDVSYMMPEVGQMMPEVMRMPRAMVDGPSCGGGLAAVTCDVIVVVLASFIHTHTHTHTNRRAVRAHAAAAAAAAAGPNARTSREVRGRTQDERAPPAHLSLRTT